MLVPSNVKYLRRQQERLFNVPSTPDIAEIVDFLMKSRALQKGNDVSDLVSMIDVMVYAGEVSYINSVILKYGIEHIGKLEFVADPGLKGKEIGEAKRKFYEEHLVEKFALLHHTIGV